MTYPGLRRAECRDEDVRTIMREATRQGAAGVTVIRLCYDYPLSLRRVLEALQTALTRGWLARADDRAEYRVP